MSRVFPFIWVLVLGCDGGSDAGNGGSDAGNGGFTGGCSPACGADEVCDYAYDWCGPPGDGDDVHACAPRVGDCDSVTPACGCDGVVYDSECAAHMAGVDIGDGGGINPICEAELTPAGRFPCGPFYCDAETSYCWYGVGDTNDRIVTCEPLPPACNGAPSCDCLPAPDLSECLTVEGNGKTGHMVVVTLI